MFFFTDINENSNVPPVDKNIKSEYEVYFTYHKSKH